MLSICIISISLYIDITIVDITLLIPSVISYCSNSMQSSYVIIVIMPGLDILNEGIGITIRKVDCIIVRCTDKRSIKYIPEFGFTILIHYVTSKINLKIVCTTLDCAYKCNVFQIDSNLIVCPINTTDYTAAL